MQPSRTNANEAYQLKVAQNADFFFILRFLYRFVRFVAALAKTEEMKTNCEFSLDLNFGSMQRSMLVNDEKCAINCDRSKTPPVTKLRAASESNDKKYLRFYFILSRSENRLKRINHKIVNFN